MEKKIEKFEIEFTSKEWNNIDAFFKFEKKISILTIKKQIYFYNDDTYLEIELTPKKNTTEEYLLCMYVRIISNNTTLDSFLYLIVNYHELFTIYNEHQEIDDCDIDIYLSIKRVIDNSFYATFAYKKECLDENTTILSSENLYIKQLQDLLIYTNFKDNKELIYFCYFCMLKPEYMIGKEKICNEILSKMNYYNYCDNFDYTGLVQTSFYDVLDCRFLDTEEIIIENTTKCIELICKCAKEHSKVYFLTSSLKTTKLEKFRNEIYNNFYELYI